MSLVVAKLRRLEQQDLLERVSPRSSKWLSPIVALTKSDGDIRICGDYKIGVNHSYPISNVEIAIHALVGMRVFTKLDLKTAYHQMPIDNNSSKGVTTINIPKGLLK